MIMVAFKMIVIGCCMLTFGAAAIGTGLIFGGYLIGAAKNPEEAENLFSSALMAFALMETFVFMALLLLTTTAFL